MLAMALLAVVKGLCSHPSQFSFGHRLFLAGFLAVIFLSFWKVWRRTPAHGDRWGFADALGYEGDSPRDIQRKIDALRGRET
jgi:hypothetical protein